MNRELKFYGNVVTIGNSRGVIIPKALLDNIDTNKRLVVTIKENHLTIIKNEVTE